LEVAVQTAPDLGNQDAATAEDGKQEEEKKTPELKESIHGSGEFC
jgi:hypothetical protein